MTAMKTSSVKSAVKLADADVSMETSGKRTGLVFLLTFLLLAAGIIGVGMFYYRSHAKQQRAEVGQQLSAIADLKVVELTQWRKERLGYANLLFQNAAFSVVVQRFFESPDDADAQHQLQTWLDKFAANMGYDRIRLLDAQGVTRLSSPIGLPTASAVVVEFAAKARQSGRVLLQDFYRSEQTQKISLGLLVPIFDEQETSRALGVLDLRIDPHVYLYPFLQRWPTPSPSAETLLVRREGNEVLFLNELRFQTNTTLNLRIPLDRLTLPAVQAVNGQESLVEGIDYRGVPVLAAVRTVPDSPWALVARIDESEVYAPLNGLLWQVGVMVVALLFGVGTCVGLLWRRQRIRFYQERAESAEVLRDITDRKLALEEASRMATVVRDSNDAITVQDFAGRITAWNHGAELIYGYSEAEALQMNIERLTAPGKIEEQKDFVRRLLEGEAVTSLETQRVTKDGRVLDVWMTVTKLVDDAGKPIGIASTERDITDRKLALEEASRMATVVRDSNDAITVQDFAGRITAWNHGAELIYGYSEAEALQMNIERLTAPGKIEEQKDFVRRLLEGEAVTSLETQRVTKDGRVLDVWMTVTKLVDDAGKPIGIASTERDITDRKLALEEASRMATQLEAANKELEAFSYSVSHDLRAPLRAIDGYGRILVEDYTERLDDEGRRVLAVISSETRRMGQLIDDLLAFSRLGRQKLEMSEINMTTLAQAVFEEQLAQAPERNLQVDLKPMSPAYGDRAMLRVVFTNLISNAIKFTKHCDPAQIEIGSRNEDGQVVYYVKDNGAGFDMKYASKLFGVFQRLHSTEEFEGTGVGLALIQSVIRHHGGRIWAEAKVNEGATFTFALPNKKGK